MKYRKRPVIIDAIQWTGTTESYKAIVELSQPDTRRIILKLATNELFVSTLEGVLAAPMNAYIVKGVQGEVYAVKEDIFNQTYERV